MDYMNGIEMKNNLRRIAFTGPECSGKTTLSLWLATHLQWTYVPEFARTFLEGKPSYTHSDLEYIAKKQLESSHVKEPCVSDTEMMVIKIWEEEKFGLTSPKIMTCFEEDHHDLYFLCRPDFEWEEDPLRENPNDRERLFEIYLNQLTFHAKPFVILDGAISTRKSTLLKHLGLPELT
jgi:nicotinamide riboside kinase